MLEVALAVGAALVALAATLSTFDRWLARRGGHEAAWAVAFAMFTVASAALAWGAGIGWDKPTFRIFYLFGAILNVPVLALGTVMLLGSERSRRVAVAAVGLFAAFCIGVMVATPFTAELPSTRLARGSEVFTPLPRVLAALASGLGTVIVVGGAVRSAFRMKSVTGAGRRAAGNVLIAAGVIITGMSGLANSVLGAMGAFALFLTIGATVIFVGYLVSTSGGTSEELMTAGAEASPPVDSSTGAATPPARSRARAG
ncbi:MAG: hypothetical protein KY395_02625 [Actinobacteria bacterium]|nr:hypothetical protein [Actinomycetota bacterium]